MAVLELLWLAGLAVIGQCSLQLHRAVRHDPRLGRAAWAAFLVFLALVIGVLYQAAVVRGDLKARYPFGFAAFDNAQVRHATTDDTLFMVFGK